MKTLIAFFIAGLLLATAVPASAKKNPKIDGCQVNGQSRKSSKEKTHYRNVTSQHMEFKKQHRQFEKQKNRLHHHGRNPNKGSHSNYKTGGFWSFHRHSYSAHIFH